MKNRFISGDLTIDIKYNDKGFYVAKLRTSDGERETVKVGVPRHLERAVDSPRSFKEAAHAAISFSKLGDSASGNFRMTGWEVRKPRSSRRTPRRKARPALRRARRR